MARFYARYSQLNGQVIGIVDTETLVSADLRNCIALTETDRLNILQDPTAYKVVNNMLIKTEIPAVLSDEALRIQALKDAAKSITTLEIDGYTYHADQNFQLNLLLGYIALKEQAISSLKLWVYKDNQWEFREHTLKQVVNLIVVFNGERQVISAKLWT